MRPFSPLKSLALIAISCLLASCSSPSDKTEDGKTIVSFWNYWTGTEHEAIRQIVDEFNNSNDEIFVKMLTISDPKTKLMLAIGSGNPPDVAHFPYYHIAGFAENDALTPLDKLCAEHGILEEDYVSVFWEGCSYRDHLWAVPLSGSVTALHYNKKIFAEVGLDPERPPQTLEELEEYNDRITRYREDGSLERIGHFPNEPGWWKTAWARWFGAEYFSEDSKALFNSPAWRATAEWLASYPQRFGEDRLPRLKELFGKFATADNPFFKGRVAMVHQGIWMDTFVNDFAPRKFDPEFFSKKMVSGAVEVLFSKSIFPENDFERPPLNFEYGVAPFPASKDSGIPFVSIAEPDTVAIPRGSKHPQEAMVFIQYLANQPTVEKLALMHRKMTCLKESSPSFFENHTHPFIKDFIEIAKSPHCMGRIQIPHYQLFQGDVGNAIDSIFRGDTTVDAALADVQDRQQRTLEKQTRRWARVSEFRLQRWEESP